MELIRDMQQSDGELEGDVYFYLFQKYIQLWGQSTIPYAYKCASYLNQLDDSVIESVCEASIRYCNTFLDDIGEPQRSFSSPRDVLALISPNTLMVPQVDDEADAVVHLGLDCDWEVEHGMEWVIRNDQVVYVGPFHSVDPFGDFSGDEEWNYAKQRADRPRPR